VQTDGFKRLDVYRLAWVARASARGLPIPKNAEPRANQLGRMLNGLIQGLRTSGESRA